MRRVIRRKRHLHGKRRFVCRVPPAPCCSASATLCDMREKLLGIELPEKMVDEICVHLADTFKGETSPRANEVESEVYRWFRHRIQIDTDRPNPLNLKYRPTVLVGPSGSGKSRLLLQMAGMWNEIFPNASNGPIACLDEDPTVEADKFLKLARQHSTVVDVLSVSTREELMELYQNTQEPKFRNHLFVDLSSRIISEELHRCSAGTTVHECFRKTRNILVLPAATKLSDLQNLQTVFADWKPEAVIFTKIDETIHLGPVLAFLVTSGLKLCLTCSGRNIMSNLIVTDVDWLLCRAGFLSDPSMLNIDDDSGFHLDGVPYKTWGKHRSVYRTISGFLPPDLFRDLLLISRHVTTYTWLGRTSDELIMAFADRSFGNVADAILWFSSDEPGVIRKSRLVADSFRQKMNTESTSIYYGSGMKPYQQSSRDYIVMTAFLTSRDDSGPPLRLNARDIEPTLLGMFFHDHEAAKMILDTLSPKDFSDPRHKMIYQDLIKGQVFSWWTASTPILIEETPREESEEPSEWEEKIKSMSSQSWVSITSMHFNLLQREPEEPAEWEKKIKSLSSQFSDLEAYLSTKKSLWEAIGEEYILALRDTNPINNSSEYVQMLIRELLALKRNS
ncbi:MAG: hypothetical protein HQM09_17580 [Candidatus Riflebacteria bacterium]|nr:hypothetical protein [Candidatus Riflebacteria bacterium]